jgi:F-box/TPR repeat protein Pof3
MMTHTISPAEYEELGKAYYKKKEYDKAIRAFTSGIDASVIPTVALYDYRAAAYEKLAHFNSAVKDGREAIRLNKRDVKGYLRTGSALQKLNKLDTAVNIYKYGMKNVPVDNRDFQVCLASETSRAVADQR